MQKRIEHFERKDPFSSEHPRHQSNIGKLTEFQQYLGTRDKWNIRPNDVLLKEKDGKIAELEAHIQDLEEQLKVHTKYGVSQKVYVEDGYLPTLIDLVQQLRELELTNGRKLLKSDRHSPYYKLVAKYFNHGGKELPLDTAHGLVKSIFRPHHAQRPAALYCDMNGFTINYDRWFIELFSFEQFSLDDWDWLSDFYDSSPNDLTITGFEDIQSVFQDTHENDKFDDPNIDQAYEVCELIVILRLQELFKEFYKTNGDNWTTIPMFVTAHDYDFIYKVN